MIPESVFSDRMHNMFASGGVLQSAFTCIKHWHSSTRRITRLGFIRAELDAFAASVKKPRNGVTKLPKNFFVERIVDRDGSHLKVDAGEVLTFLVILSYLCMRVFVPSGRFLEEYLMHAKAGSCRPAREAKV